MKTIYVFSFYKSVVLNLTHVWYICHVKCT